MAFISLSGVMMPGPVFAVTMAKGQRQPLAGVFISFGHALVELPMVILIYFGLGRFFSSPVLKIIIGLLGGSALILIGLDMIRKRNDLSSGCVELPYGSVTAGLLTSVANPYFFIWWATVGAALVLKSSDWGLLGLLSFFIVHWLCDFSWSTLVSGTSFKASGLWSGKVHRIVFGGCGFLLVCFGMWFIYGVL